ncbi:MAG: hypothetical protein AB7U20_18645 [Planctomycetaceae bacterium]
MPRSKLPASIAAFVEAERTVAVERITDGVAARAVPYGHFWQRAIAAMLLSGRVKPRQDGSPNLTDVNRICKEANFNQRLFERFSGFLVHAQIVESARNGNYQSGPHAAAFWDRDLDGLRKASRGAFLRFVGRFTGYQIWRPTTCTSSQLDAFFGAFAQAFEGRAVREDRLAGLLVEFAGLPARDLWRLAKRVASEISEHECHWVPWLDKTVQQAFLSATYWCDWAYGATYRKQDWIYVSDVARIMLGFEEPPPPELQATEFRVLPNLCVFAGADLPAEKLVPLFRSCQIKRIDRVLEFQLDKRQLVETAANGEAAQQLRAVLQESEPLPATVESLLGSRPHTGEVRIKGCSAIVKPESPDVLDAIKRHRRLKGYLEPGAPPGYLLIKQNSNPHGFIERCREFGFTVKVL